MSRRVPLNKHEVQHASLASSLHLQDLPSFCRHSGSGRVPGRQFGQSGPWRSAHALQRRSVLFEEGIRSQPVLDSRKSPRRASLTRCTVEKCFSKDGQISSRTVNFSATGFMLELDYPLSPGDAIKIQFASDAEETGLYGACCCLGMVRWCKAQDGSCGGFYGVGVELARQTPRRYVY